MNQFFQISEKAALAAVVSFALIPPEKIFPLVLIVLDVAAAFVAFQTGDIRRAVYWSAAAILTASVTF